MRQGGTSRSMKRRILAGQPYFTGNGLDVGGGSDPLARYAALLGFDSCRNWDLPDGDAQYLASVPDDTYDFLFSSHSLEHMVDPNVALANWIRVVRSGGHLVVVVPDEELYEHLHWPSHFNGDHKWSFTIYRGAPLLPKSVNVLDLLTPLWNSVEIIKIERIEEGFRYDLGDIDQTALETEPAECSIEIVLRKKQCGPSAGSKQTFPSFTSLADCRCGQLLYPAKDPRTGLSLREYGQYCQGESDFMAQFIRKGAVVLDIGASIGVHSIPLAQMVGPEGVVVAFEPQPILHQLLDANLELNSIPNVLTYAMALGDHEGESLMPALDYAQAVDFGAVALDTDEEGLAVAVSRLDDFHLERVDFIKLSVSGYELKVLAGAGETIARCHPIMYIENDRFEKSAELIQHLLDQGYRLWWHTPPLFSPNNFKRNHKNHFPNLSTIKMLAIHQSMRPVEGLKPILTPEDTWF